MACTTRWPWLIAPAATNSARRHTSGCWRDERLYPADPLMAEITDLLKTAVVYEIRGTRAMDDRKWAEAAALFREGLKVAPRDATLHQNLGTALYLAGDPRAAEAEFEEAIRLLPGYAKPLFSLGVLMEERGRDTEAIDRFQRAVASDPHDGECSRQPRRRAAPIGQARCGDCRIRLEIVKIDPSASEARFGRAMALVRLRRFAEARSVLEDAVRAHPEQPGLAHALARLLASAPDDAVRDGRRALSIMQSLEKTTAPNVALIETTAMALAETGRFADAIGATTSGDRDGHAGAAQRNLVTRLYRESSTLRVEHALENAVGRRRPGSLPASRAALILDSELQAWAQAAIRAGLRVQQMGQCGPLAGREQTRLAYRSGACRACRRCPGFASSTGRCGPAA